MSLASFIARAQFHIRTPGKVSLLIDGVAGDLPAGDSSDYSLRDVGAFGSVIELPTAQRSTGKATISHDKAAFRKKCDQRKRLQLSDTTGQSSEGAGLPQRSPLISRAGENGCSNVAGKVRRNRPPLEKCAHRADIPRHLWANIEEGLLTDRSARSRQAPCRLSEELHGNRVPAKEILQKGKPHGRGVSLPSKVQLRASGEIQDSMVSRPSRIEIEAASPACKIKEPDEKIELREKIAWYKAKSTAMASQACDVNI